METLARLLHFSDLHLDAPFAQFSTAQARERRENLRRTLKNICELGRQLNVDAVTCGGDLYEYERVAPDTQLFLQNLFAEYSDLTFLISPGNHDWYGKASIYKVTGWSKNVHIFTESTLEPWNGFAGLTIWGGAHHGSLGAGNFLSNFKVSGDGIHIGLFHGSASLGIEKETKKERHAAFEPQEIAASGLHHALLGHFHNKTEAENYTYPGNPDPLTFGESEGRGAVLVTIFDSGLIEREWHSEVAESRVSEIRVGLQGEATSTDVLSTIRQAVRDQEGYLRIILSGSIADSAHIDIREIENISEPAIKAIKVKVEGIRVEKDFEELAREKTVLGKFVSNVLAANLSEERKQKILMIGFRALSGEKESLEVL